eukprot:5402188-Pyramimonas_sp.AAC.1
MSACCKKIRVELNYLAVNSEHYIVLGCGRAPGIHGCPDAARAALQLGACAVHPHQWRPPLEHAHELRLHPCVRPR